MAASNESVEPASNCAFGFVARFASGSTELAKLLAQTEGTAVLQVTGVNTIDGFKYLLDDGGWMCIRFSGTEPIMRFYVETTQDAKRLDILEAGLKLAGLK